MSTMCDRLKKRLTLVPIDIPHNMTLFKLNDMVNKVN